MLKWHFQYPAPVFIPAIRSFFTFVLTFCSWYCFLTFVNDFGLGTAPLELEFALFCRQETGVGIHRMIKNYIIAEANDHCVRIQYKKMISLKILVIALMSPTVFVPVFIGYMDKQQHKPITDSLVWGGLGLVTIAFMLYLFWKAATLREVCADQEGLSKVYVSKTEHSLWADLTGVDFSKDLFLFRDGTKINLYGLKDEMAAVVRVVGRETPLGKAWEAYVRGKIQGLVQFERFTIPGNEKQSMSNIDITQDGMRIWYSQKEKWSLWLLTVISVFVFLYMLVMIVLMLFFHYRLLLVPYFVLTILVPLPMYTLNVLCKKSQRNEDFFFRETCITSEGIYRVPRFGKPKHWSWNMLSGIDFSNGILEFEDGKKVRLYDRILLDMERVVSIVGPDSRLAKAWEDYLTNPQPDRGIIPC